RNSSGGCSAVRTPVGRSQRHSAACGAVPTLGRFGLCREPHRLKGGAGGERQRVGAFRQTTRCGGLPPAALFRAPKKKAASLRVWREDKMRVRRIRINGERGNISVGAHVARS